MFLAALALLLPQTTYQGAVYEIDVPAERLVVREGANEQFYILDVLDPAAQNVEYPPLRVLFLKEETQRSSTELLREVRADVRKALKAAGATAGEEQDVIRTPKGAGQYGTWFPVTDQEGRVWRFEFMPIFHSYRIGVAMLCIPADLESQRSKDVIAAFTSLKYQSFDLDNTMQFDVLGLQMRLPLHFQAAMQGNETGAFLEAKQEGTHIQLRAFRAASPAAATEQAAAIRGQLAANIEDSVEKEKLPYFLTDNFPTTHAVDGHSASGLITQLVGHADEPDGWRHDLVFSIGDVAYLLTTVILVTEPISRGFNRFEALLDSMHHPEVEAWGRLAFGDDFRIAYGTGLESRRVENDHGFRWEFRRRGMERAKWGEIWVEVRDDLEYSEKPDVRAVYVRFDLIGEERPSSTEWIDGVLLGKWIRGVRNNFRDLDLTIAEERSMAVFSKPYGTKTLVAGCYGPWMDGTALRGLLSDITRGMTSTKGVDSVTYEDAGVSYSFNPRVVHVASGEEPGTSLARMRETTITTSWAPLTAGLFGGPRPLQEALENRIADKSALWALEGAVTEPSYGDSLFGDVDAKFSHVRQTLDNGTEWDFILMVGDTAERRLWVEVVAPVADTEAATTMTSVLATVQAK